MEYISLVVAFIALLVTFWQGFLSKQQLEQAKETKKDTERLLDEIKQKIVRIEAISDETRKDIKEQISNMINKNDENFKELLKSGKEIDQNQLMNAILPNLINNPNSLNNLMEFAKNNQK